MGLERLLLVVWNLLTISPYVRVFGFEVARVDPLREEGILPCGRCEGVRGPMGLMVVNFWDISL
jgi:hypothetical protein